MNPEESGSRHTIAKIVRESLECGRRVEIEGLGTFLPGKDNGFRFVAQTKPRVFLAYVEEDAATVRKLYRGLARAGYQPWMDKMNLLPGQNWPRSICAAIQTSDYFVPCFSNRASVKRGTFHSELRFALECAATIPLDEVFLIPVRLDACVVPARITKHIQYVDLFPEWDKGFSRILLTLNQQEEARRRKRQPLAS